MNGAGTGYIVAGYTICLGVLFLYAVSLVLRRRRLARSAALAEPRPPGSAAGSDASPVGPGTGPVTAAAGTLPPAVGGTAGLAGLGGPGNGTGPAVSGDR